MKKLLCILSIFTSLTIITGCDESRDKTHAFVGHWKAISKDSGEALHPKLSSEMDIICKDSTCHIVSRKKSVLSDDELVSNTDWDVKNETTLMKGNGIASIYVRGDKLIANNLVYEKQKE